MLDVVQVGVGAAGVGLQAVFGEDGEDEIPHGLAVRVGCRSQFGPSHHGRIKNQVAIGCIDLHISHSLQQVVMEAAFEGPFDRAGHADLAVVGDLDVQRAAGHVDGDVVVHEAEPVGGCRRAQELLPEASV